MPSAKRQPFCLDLNVLRWIPQDLINDKSINIDSGKGLVVPDNKPLPETMLVNSLDATSVPLGHRSNLIAKFVIPI